MSMQKEIQRLNMIIQQLQKENMELQGKLAQFMSASDTQQETNKELLAKYGELRKEQQGLSKEKLALRKENVELSGRLSKKLMDLSKKISKGELEEATLHRIKAETQYYDTLSEMINMSTKQADLIRGIRPLLEKTMIQDSKVATAIQDAVEELKMFNKNYMNVENQRRQKVT